jgi:hypothetical protein
LAAIPRLCFRSRYETLEDGEEEGKREDMRQVYNHLFAKWLFRLSVLMGIGIILKLLLTEDTMDDVEEVDEWSEEDFARFQPLVLVLAFFEVLACAACASTAETMYKQPRHSLRHPESEASKYVKVELNKDGEDLFGICFRPSTDGLECLFVEAVKRGALERWNEASRALSGDPESESSSSTVPPKTAPQVRPGSSIVAVNEVHGDIGLMQVQLSQPRATLWICDKLFHACNEFAMPDETLPSATPAVVVGNVSDPAASGGMEAPKLSVACLPLEDEEPQILVRWVCCGLIFGWVTLLPVLLMQPHPNRPRQQLFRHHLLKPCLFILPVWLIMWAINTVEVAVPVKIVHPFWYFTVVHMLLPAVLTFYALRMQAADEKQVLEQRASREQEVGTTVCAEDPLPLLLKELITMNPIAMVWLGCTASVPLVVSSLLTPMKTKRGRAAQGHLHLIYMPLIVLQLAFAVTLYKLTWDESPELYLASFGLLFTLPVFCLWCGCLLCSSRWNRKDARIIRKQRLDRAARAHRTAIGLKDDARENGVAEEKLNTIVECGESQREWELVYSA